VGVSKEGPNSNLPKGLVKKKKEKIPIAMEKQTVGGPETHGAPAERGFDGKNESRSWEKKRGVALAFPKKRGICCPAQTSLRNRSPLLGNLAKKKGRKHPGPCSNLSTRICSAAMPLSPDELHKKKLIEKNTFKTVPRNWTGGIFKKERAVP